MPAALLDIFTRRGDGVVVAGGLLLEPGRFRRLGLGFGLRGAGLRCGLVGERLSLVHLLDVRGELLAHLLGLDVPALVTPASRGEDERGEHDHRHDCDNDPNGGVLFMAVPFVGNPGTSLTHPLIPDSLRGGCRNPACRTGRVVDLGRLLH